jgi:hypothetical protein
VSLPPVVHARPGCPDLETLAAFAEGRLVGGDRNTVVEHLADCDACREIVVETQSLLAAETAGAGAGGEVVPFREPKRGGRLPLLAALAAAVALAAVGLFVWSERGASATRVLAAIAADPAALTRLGDGWSEPLWSVTRGEGPLVSEPARAFRLGVRSADLDFALAAGDRRAARRFAAESALLVGDVPLADPIAHVYREIARRAGEASEPLAKLPEDAAIAARLTREAVDPAYWELGRWSETGRLAAASGVSVGLPRRPHLPASAPADLAELVAAAARPELDAPLAARAGAFARVVARGGDLR